MANCSRKSRVSPHDSPLLQMCRILMPLSELSVVFKDLHVLREPQWAANLNFLWVSVVKCWQDQTKQIPADNKKHNKELQGSQQTLTCCCGRRTLTPGHSPPPIRRCDCCPCATISRCVLKLTSVAINVLCGITIYQNLYAVHCPRQGCPTAETQISNSEWQPRHN